MAILEKQRLRVQKARYQVLSLLNLWIIQLLQILLWTQE